MKGISSHVETSMSLTALQLRIAATCLSVAYVRVGSNANVADGPSRLCFEDMRRLQARFVIPALPQHVHNIRTVPLCPLAV